MPVSSVKLCIQLPPHPIVGERFFCILSLTISSAQTFVSQNLHFGRQAYNDLSKIQNTTNLQPLALLHFPFTPHRVRLLRMKTGPAQSINVQIPTGPGAPLPPGQERFAGLESVHYSCHKGANF